jgi:hypothetical protein
VKARFVGGPFGGRKFDVDGRNEVIIRDRKKMTRKQRWEWERDMWNVNPFLPPYPTVEARYKIAMRPHGNMEHVVYAPCQHPDGSLFYEYVEGSKREL